MKEYFNYKVSDFVQDDDFIRWVRSEHYDQALNNFWKNWIAEHPSQREDIEEAIGIIQAFLSENQFVPNDFQQRKALSKVLDSIHGEVPKHTEISWMKPFSIAATITFLLVSAYGIWVMQADSIIKENIVRERFTSHHKNLQSKPQVFLLSDGSLATLQPKSEIFFNTVEGDSLREVYLEGEAFFEVVKNADKPFLVHTSQIITRVLGTSFNVRSFPDENEITVKVKTGRVSVFKDLDDKVLRGAGIKQMEGLILKPNHQAVFSRVDQKMTKSLVEQPAMIVQDKVNEFEFKDTPMEQVFKTVEKAYGVEIIFDRELLMNCYLNAAFEDEPFFEKLDLICKAIHGTYRIVDSQIIIHSKGCSSQK